jgi:hypothetical protein
VRTSKRRATAAAAAELAELLSRFTKIFTAALTLDESALAVLNAGDDALPDGWTWAIFGGKHGWDRNLAELHKRIDVRDQAHRFIEQLERYSATATNEAASVPDRIIALSSFVHVRYDITDADKYRLPGVSAAVRASCSCMSREDALSLLQALVDAHAETLAAAAVTSRRDYDELILLRSAARKDSTYRAKDGFPRYNFRSARIDWHAPVGMRELVCRYIQAPTCWDLELKPEIVPLDFLTMVVKALRTGTVVDAKICQALLVQSAELRAQVTSQLRTAITWYAQSGSRPAVTLIFGTRELEDLQ